ncbi:MAG: VWA domain-containing protein [Armatimonadota bacterium]|nr:VWA domain-containing protein [Armatimonadota bacterium]MDW8143510.1 VWA domain-containing protein [Armatimonadota bacterium]
MHLFEFAKPQALFAIPVWLLAIIAIAWGMKQKRKRLTFWLSAEEVNYWWRRAKRQVFLFGAATLLLTVALAQPRYFAGKVTVPVQGVDILICLDVSHSMLCEDIKPSRLEFAQAIIANLMERLQPGDRVGLVVFGGSGFPLCPLTHDHSIVYTYLTLLSPSLMVYNPTTYLAEGLTTSLKLLKGKQKRETRGSVIVLLTDGEDQGSNWKQVTSECAKAGVTVFAFAIGTEKGAPVPEVTETGTVRGYKRNPEGGVAISKLTLEPLQYIARKTGGKVYLPVDTQREVEALVRDLNGYRQRVWTRQVAQWRELFPLLVFLGTLLLLCETWLTRSSRT